MEKAKEVKEVDIKRVYNSLIVVLVIQALLLLSLYISCIKDMNILYWVSLLLIIASLVPLAGGLDLIYTHRKNGK